MSKNSIAIFCRSFTEGGDPFTSDYYWDAYQDLYFALKDRGMQVYFVTDNNTYLDYGRFSVAYQIDKKTTLKGMQPVKNVQVDMVYDRGGFIGRNVLTMNSAYMQKVCASKIDMYNLFAKFQPYSMICNDKQELHKAFEQIQGDKIVVKEPDGMGGKQVYIGDKEEILPQLPDQYPLLVQEFLDTSAGIPGIVQGVHDVRLTVCGGEIAGFYVRMAKAGQLHSNVSRGGKMVFLKISEVPFELAMAVKSIDETFVNDPRYYSIDFMLTPKGWKLLEINGYIALLPQTDGIEARKTSAKLADYLAGVCRDQARTYDMATSAAKRR